MRNDPLPVFCIKVTLEIPGAGYADLFSKSVGGLKVETEVVDYRSGGVNDSTFKLLGATKWNNIVLKKGDEMGRFLLGSTVVLLFPKEGHVQFNASWQEATPVRMGEPMSRT